MGYEIFIVFAKNRARQHAAPSANATQSGYARCELALDLLSSLAMICLRAFVALLLSLTLLSAQEMADLNAIHRIKAEGFQNSQIMETLFWLTDAKGPRVTNSKGYRDAAEWAIAKLKEYGLQNVHTEAFPFGTSWNWKRFSGHMIEPAYSPLIGFPMAWTPGTNGMIEGEAVFAPIRAEADFDKFRGKLKGKMVLTQDAKNVLPQTAPLGRRLSDKDLEDRAAGDPTGRGGRPDASTAGGAPPPTPEARAAATRFRTKLNQFLKDEGVAVSLQAGYNGDGGTVFAAQAASYKAGTAIPPPTVALTPEHYDRILRLIEHKIPVKLAFDIQTEITAPEDSFNIIGEITGTSKRDEIVMIGGHFDSWHGGTGATDNATGTSVAMEAMRILKSLNVPFKRTIRIGLWGGEEEGLLGSIDYVKKHYADRADMKLKPEFSKLDVYFNSDTGTGKFRGISVGGNDEVLPIFKAWAKPLRDLGFQVVLGASSAPLTAPGGTDHTTFDYAGLPGFGFLQEPMEYQSRTHHSNMDTYDRVQKGDVMQSAVIMAVFAYHAAMRDQMIPRKEIPAPKPWRAE